MLYPKNQARELSDELFRNPTAEYRAAPFWAWNAHPEKEELSRQIDVFRKMGFGGFHMHVRSGMDIEYLSEAFFDRIRHCVGEAEARGMLAWLYDEDRWPSGAVGGKLTKKPANRQHYLLWTRIPYCGKITKRALTASGSNYAERTENGTLLARYAVTLNADGTLASYRRLADGDAAGADTWYAYVETPSPNPWYNGETYADLLNPEVTKQFVAMTHETYRREVGEKFGKSIPAIFTDEPQMAQKRCLSSALEGEDATLPWTPDMERDFQSETGADLLARLPEVFWDLPEGAPSELRWMFHNYVSERFARSFADVCGKWCAENGLPLTGHVMREPTLASQTGATGETMRSYRSFTIPGIDMLRDSREYTTAVQCRSAVRQYGREAMTSEEYGVTGWNFDFAGHKRQGDWQAALGVTVRVPHLAFYSMRGEAKRDYPASIGYQSPWCAEYARVEDHFARVATALTRGTATARVAVVHPIESYWLSFGPDGESAARKTYLEQSFLDLTEWLLFGGVDFDFLSEALLPDLCLTGGNPLTVGKMRYDAVIVPPLLTLKASTIDRLEAFVKAGGELIFTSDQPPYCDAKPSDRIAAAFRLAKHLPFDRTAILEAADPYRTVELTEDGERATGLLCALRRDETCQWLFLAQGRAERYDGEKCVGVTLRGKFDVEEYDTATGEHRPIHAAVADGKTTFFRKMADCDSLLCRLTERKEDRPACVEKPTVPARPLQLPEQFHYTTDEANVLLIDAAEYALDGETWQPRTEILRLDNACRRRLGLPTRESAFVQPWAVGKETPTHTLALRFTVRNESHPVCAKFAVELADGMKLTLNGKAVDLTPDGYYVDRVISTVPLPELRTGDNLFELTMPFGKTTNVEWCYLVGKFGVRVEGDRAVLTDLPEMLTAGDLAGQGFPFFGGNLTYEWDAETDGTPVCLSLPGFGGTYVRVLADGTERAWIAYPPYRAEFALPAGKHTFALSLCVPRTNAFGPVHNYRSSAAMAAPNHWRTDGEKWSDDYLLTPQGIWKDGKS